MSSTIVETLYVLGFTGLQQIEAKSICFILYLTPAEIFEMNNELLYVPNYTYVLNTCTILMLILKESKVILRCLTF